MDILFITLLLVGSHTDIKKREIPDTVSICILALSLFDFHPLGVFIAIPYLIASMVAPDKIGGGDIKLTASAGLYLGFESGLFALIVAQTLFVIYHYLSGRKANSLPLAPFLTVGFILTMTGGV